MATLTPSIAPWTAERAKHVWPWLTEDGISIANITQHYRENGEEGIDIGLTLHTEVTALYSGVVTKAWFGDELNPPRRYGGIIFVQCLVNGLTGPQVVYYQHMDTIAVKVGDHIQVGQVVGLSGGQLSGGFHPETQPFSTGPHIEIGINPPGNPGFVNGPNVNPEPIFTQLLHVGPGLADQLGLGQVQALSNSATYGTKSPVSDSFAGITFAIDESLALHPFFIPNANIITNPYPNTPVIGGIINFLELPFQSANNIVDIFSGVVYWIGANTIPVFLRFLIVATGFLIILGVIWSLLQSLPQVQEAEQAAPTVIGAS